MHHIHHVSSTMSCFDGAYTIQNLAEMAGVLALLSLFISGTVYAVGKILKALNK